MNLLVTDYDGTLFTDSKSISKNIKKLQELQKHHFYIMISTGRCLPSIKEEITKYHIPYDYLNCADGALIYDNQDNLLKCYKMSHQIIKQILNFKDNISYKEIQISYNDGYSDQYYHKPISSINIVIDNQNITSQIIKDFQKLQENNPQYNFLIYTHTNTSFLCVKDKGVSKALGIAYLKNKLKIANKNIYVIGDGNNDMEMIKEYKGYNIKNSTINYKEISQKEYNHFYEFIDDILKEQPFN